MSELEAAKETVERLEEVLQEYETIQGTKRGTAEGRSSSGKVGQLEVE